MNLEIKKAISIAEIFGCVMLAYTDSSAILKYDVSEIDRRRKAVILQEKLKTVKCSYHIDESHKGFNLYFYLI